MVSGFLDSSLIINSPDYLVRLNYVDPNIPVSLGCLTKTAKTDQG